MRESHYNDWIDEYEDLNDEYDYHPTHTQKPVNNRMGTLNRQQGIINRYRNKGIIR